MANTSSKLLIRKFVGKAARLPLSGTLKSCLHYKPIKKAYLICFDVKYLLRMIVKYPAFLRTEFRMDEPV